MSGSGGPGGGPSGGSGMGGGSCTIMHIVSLRVI